MLYLSGVLCKPLTDARRVDVGFMTTARIGNTIPDWITVAYDNDRFVEHTRPGSWVESVWMEWLPAQRPGLFAVVPDVVGDARATRELFDHYAPFVQSTKQRLAYAAQDGSECYPPPWDDFDVLFVGGSDEFKLSEPTWSLCREAKERGKWVHNGRVNSLRRLRACYVSGVDSADGTYLRWPDANWPKLCRYLDSLNGQGRL